MKEPTKEELKVRAAKILNEFENIRKSPLTVVEFGWLQTAIAQALCEMAIELLKEAAKEFD